ncbi:MAG: AMP-binding protein, partial [Burkholderiales bacterium]
MRDEYRSLYEQFRWQVPSRFNIAAVCCDRWTRERDRVAIIEQAENGGVRRWTYRELGQAAARLANALRALGVGRGDRVAIILPQRAEAAIAHVALYRLGAIVMPMSVLFGPDALEYRFADSEAVCAIVDAQYADNVRAARASCPHLRHLILVAAPGIDDGPRAGERDWDTLLERASERLRPVSTGADAPADLIYTSGTTGPPKGALIAQRALIGNLPGFVASQNWFPRPGDVFWSPADWAWTGGLMDALLPSLYFGMPIVAYRGRFSAETAFELIARHRVTNAFLFPTALKMMMKASGAARPPGVALRAVMSAGEAVGQTVFDWCQQTLGLTVNEMFGQTEINYIVGN